MKKYIIVLALALFMVSAFAPHAYADTAKATKKAQRQEASQNTATSTVATTTTTATDTPVVIAPPTQPPTQTMLPFSKQTVLYVLYGVAFVIAVALIAGLFGTMGILFIITLGGALVITVILVLIASFTSIL